MNPAQHPNFAPEEVEVASDLARYSVDSILGMPTYEGVVDVTHVTSDGMEEKLPLRIRLVLGPSLSLPDRSYYGKGSQNADALSAMFFSAAQVTGFRTRAWLESEGSDQATDQAYRLMLRESLLNGTPVTVIWAHGNSVHGRQAILTRPDAGHWLSDVIDAVQARDRQATGRPQVNSTVLLAACNPGGIELRHEGVTILYRAGLAGYMATSKLTISRAPRKRLIRWLPF